MLGLYLRRRLTCSAFDLIFFLTRFRYGRCCRPLVWNLHENLVILDHSKFKTGALFNGIVTLLEVAYFRIEARIAQLQLTVNLLLRPQLLIDIPDAQPTPLAEP